MEGGAKRVVIVLVIAAVAALGVFWYWQRSKQRALESGNVYVKSEGQTASLSANPGAASIEPEAPVPSQPSASLSASAASAPKPSASTEKTAHASPSGPNPAPPPMTQPRGALEVPAADTIPRNPPNGLVFAGAGKYQLYRQGDITWRLDTNTGRACIIFATDAQWSRTRVYDQGCGAS